MDTSDFSIEERAAARLNYLKAAFAAGTLTPELLDHHIAGVAREFIALRQTEAVNGADPALDSAIEQLRARVRIIRERFETGDLGAVELIAALHDLEDEDAIHTPTEAATPAASAVEPEPGPTSETTGDPELDAWVDVLRKQYAVGDLTLDEAVAAVRALTTSPVTDNTPEPAAAGTTRDRPYAKTLTAISWIMTAAGEVIDGYLEGGTHVNRT